MKMLDPLVEHPRSAATIGLLLVALLVPVLRFWHGASGPLGQSLPLIFLIPVVLASAVGGRWPGVIASCAALVVWDWFFIPPLSTVTIASVRDLLALLIFLAVALLVGQLSTVARRRTDEALRRARSSQALYDLNLALIGRRDLADVLRALTERLQEIFDLEACAVLRRDPATETWRTVVATGVVRADLRVEGNRSLAAIASRVEQSGTEVALGRVQRRPGRSERMPRRRPGQERARFLPLRVGARSMGVLELAPRPGERPDPERERLLATFANGAALAIEQARLAEEEQAAAVMRESDRLKSALLSSVSHDLRTPLAGIKAASSSLMQHDMTWSEENRAAFIADIDAEADRLTRLVSNLLDLSRIEAGALKPLRDWEDVGELINRVLGRLGPRLAGHEIVRDLPESLPAVQLDAVQIEQVLANLLENAAKYAPAGTRITARACVEETRAGERSLRIDVSDQGPGIPAGEQERIFATFYRIAGPAHRAGGTGMGLAIVKGLVEAHGGHVAVASAPGQGSTFSVSLPLARDEQRPAGIMASTRAGEPVGT